jgi:hypothetical protein
LQIAIIPVWLPGGLAQYRFCIIEVSFSRHDRYQLPGAIFGAAQRRHRLRQTFRYFAQGSTRSVYTLDLLSAMKRA